MHEVTDWKISLNALEKQKLTLMVTKDGKVLFRSNKRGVLPLVEMLESNFDNLVGTTVVDRVVGVAAAKLLLWQHVQRIDAVVASRPAKDLLSHSGIILNAREFVTELRDPRTKRACRYEAMAVKHDHPEELYHALRNELLIFHS